jgi:hypothetical protein
VCPSFSLAIPIYNQLTTQNLGQLDRLIYHIARGADEKCWLLTSISFMHRIGEFSLARQFPSVTMLELIAFDLLPLNALSFW